MYAPAWGGVLESRKYVDTLCSLHLPR
jgi:hypothetical protein